MHLREFYPCRAQAGGAYFRCAKLEGADFDDADVNSARIDADVTAFANARNLARAFRE